MPGLRLVLFSVSVAFPSLPDHIFANWLSSACAFFRKFQSSIPDRCRYYSRYYLLCFHKLLILNLNFSIRRQAPAPLHYFSKFSKYQTRNFSNHFCLRFGVIIRRSLLGIFNTIYWSTVPSKRLAYVRKSRDFWCNVLRNFRQHQRAPRRVVNFHVLR